MALSTKKKNIIIADWKTGAYTKKQLEKKHKTTYKTLAKIIQGIEPTNADIVRVCSEAENAKKSIKNPHEIKAVETVVKERLKVQEIGNKILDKLDRFLDNGKAQKVVTLGQGDGVSKSEIVEYDLQAKDYKDLADTVDKASVTLGVNKRFSEPTKIENTNAQQNNQDTTITIVRDS